MPTTPALPNALPDGELATAAPPLTRPIVGRTGKDVFSAHRPLARVWNLVQDRFREPLALAEAARAAGFETTYFCRYFKRRVGIGFPAFLQRFRLAVAVRLLATTDLSVLEVSSQCGFGSVRSLERATRRWLGCAPTRLRCQEAAAREGQTAMTIPVAFFSGSVATGALGDR